jgi:hypothetical protein
MELQHINVKLFLDSSPNLDLWDIVPVFHSWIQGQSREELLIDVADYRHVPCGPGIILIGHDADYSLDNSENRLGIRYNRKNIVSGTNRDRLSLSLGMALKACERLEADPRLKGQIQFGRREIKVFVNDRLLVTNLPSSYESIESEIKDFFADLMNGLGIAIHREETPGNFFALTVKTSGEFEVYGLLKKLGVQVSETVSSSAGEKLN